MNEQKSFSTWLEEKLSKSAMNLSSFATLSTLPISTLHSVLKGKNTPSLETVLKIIRPLKIEETDLYSELTGTHVERNMHNDDKDFTFPTTTHLDNICEIFITNPVNTAKSLLEIVNSIRYKLSESVRSIDSPLEGLKQSLLQKPISADELCMRMINAESKFFEGDFRYPSDFNKEIIYKIFHQNGAFLREDFEVISEPNSAQPVLILDGYPLDEIFLIEGKANHIYKNIKNIEFVSRVKLDDLILLDQVSGSSGITFTIAFRVAEAELIGPRSPDAIRRFLIILSRWIAHFNLSYPDWITQTLAPFNRN